MEARRESSNNSKFSSQRQCLATLESPVPMELLLEGHLRDYWNRPALTKFPLRSILFLTLLKVYPTSSLGSRLGATVGQLPISRCQKLEPASNHLPPHATTMQ